jgi:membrane protease subunit (stomatin/prohibitin family)
VRFVIGYHGQAAGAQDNDAILNWIKGLFFMSVKTVIGQICAQQGKSLLNLGGMSLEISGRITQSAPNLDEIGIKILQIGNFNINFAPEDQKRLNEANKARAEARRGVGISSDQARAKQFEMDQKFQQDARYVQHLAGSPAWNNYAAGQAMMGAGEGMAKGGNSSGVAQLGAQAAIGMNMAHMMQPQNMAPQYAPGGAPQAPQSAPAGAQSVEVRLQKLADLKQKGLISEEDFQARKAKILEDI